MTTVASAYQALKRRHGALAWPEFEVPGGKAAVSPDATLAIVCTDGRYPAPSQGFHLNERITETEQLLWGSALVEFLQPPEQRSVRAGDVVQLLPGRPYALSGRCVSLVHMDPPWDASQKSFIPAPAEQPVRFLPPTPTEE
jgi:hypothetical protein